jgi:hypothetical protein
MKNEKNSQGLLLRKGYHKRWKWMLVKIWRSAVVPAIVACGLCYVAPAQATIYVTADNGTSNLFGTLDVATGQFTQINTTSPLFFALTNGPGGKIYGADANSGGLFKIRPSGVTVPFGSVTAPAPSVFFGLAYSSAAGKFFADNLDLTNPATNVDLFSIAGDGNSRSFVGTLAGPNSGFFPTGNLVFGPGGTLYFDYSSDLVNGTNSTLYAVDPVTGALTAVGNGLGTGVLALFSDGTALYGVDAVLTSDIGIYTINPTTGVATQISTVTGLPKGDYFVDTATGSAPDTSSTFGLLFLALTTLLGAGRLRHRFGVTA